MILEAHIWKTVMRGLGLSWGLEFATGKPKPRTMFVGCWGSGMLRNVFRDRLLKRARFGCKGKMETTIVYWG